MSDTGERPHQIQETDIGERDPKDGFVKFDPDSVTIKLPDNGISAIVRKVNGRYEVFTGWIEKWPD